MSAGAPFDFDVAIIGAGPVGSVAALAHARKDARVVLIEANPKGAHRLAGEWLHPPALDIFRELGIDLCGLGSDYPTGEGFVLYPDDGSSPVILPYANATRGISCAHAGLLGHLRYAASIHPAVRYWPNVRVTGVDGNRLHLSRRHSGAPDTVTAARIVGADGRNSVVRQAMGLPLARGFQTRMIGVRLPHAELPFEGYGHVFFGSFGPILVYRIAWNVVRLIADVPMEGSGRQAHAAAAWEGASSVLPEGLRAPLRRALEEEPPEMAVNSIRPRTVCGRGPYALVGDAAGHYHPLTALGMTIGFDDARCLAESESPEAYDKARRRACRVPELVTMGIYEVFSESGGDAIAVRHSIIDILRKSPRERRLTMAYLACQARGLMPFALSFGRVLAGACVRALDPAASRGGWRPRLSVTASLFSRSGLWLSTTMFRRGIATTRADGGNRPQVLGPEIPFDASLALARSARALAAWQARDGSWEGEVEWCPMLAAQYAIMCHITRTPILPTRRLRILRNFEATRLADGTWGLHAHSHSHLFVSALVYVAARLLGLRADDPLLVPAARFIHAEGGVAAIPSWGKFWLAMLGLYEWRGVNALLPETRALPRWVPLHPSNFYCHTRLIYLAMSAIFARKFVARATPVIEELRRELYPGGYACTRFSALRNRLRASDLYKPPSRVLRLVYACANAYERVHSRKLRTRMHLSALQAIRWELATSSHTSISPVSGLLNMIALWMEDEADPDYLRAREAFEGWIWEDDEAGLRVAGARSASWDGAFAVQALAAASPHVELSDALDRGRAFLASQQIRTSFPGYEGADRIDPNGGWCFAGAWHGWPVSDCTAEATCALLAGRKDGLGPADAEAAARFILRCQNRDGGFGSYEPRQTRIGLEWLNPAEMFGDSMTEVSYVECTASCIAALSAIGDAHPHLLATHISRSIDRAASWLRRRQQADGAWAGTWGVHYIYGTMFAISGLRAAGVPATDPGLRRACRWLKDRQRGDGAWGEHHSSCVRGRYVPHSDGQVIQTAWALKGLLEAEDTEWERLRRAAAWLVAQQSDDGTWPRQDMAGVFFHTALLEYELYRAYFPVWALALYETRRAMRTFEPAVQTPGAELATAPAPTSTAQSSMAEARLGR